MEERKVTRVEEVMKMMQLNLVKNRRRRWRRTTTALAECGGDARAEGGGGAGPEGGGGTGADRCGAEGRCGWVLDWKRKEESRCVLLVSRLEEKRRGEMCFAGFS